MSPLEQLRELAAEGKVPVELVCALELEIHGARRAKAALQLFAADVERSLQRLVG